MLPENGKVYNLSFAKALWPCQNYTGLIGTLIKSTFVQRSESCYPFCQHSWIVRFVNSVITQK